MKFRFRFLLTAQATLRFLRYGRVFFTMFQICQLKVYAVLSLFFSARPFFLSEIFSRIISIAMFLDYFLLLFLDRSNGFFTAVSYGLHKRFAGQKNQADDHTDR